MEGSSKEGITKIRTHLMTSSVKYFSDSGPHRKWFCLASMLKAMSEAVFYEGVRGGRGEDYMSGNKARHTDD